MYFQVRIGEEISASYDILNGIPHGTVISLILFYFMVNDLFERVKASIEKALYAYEWSSMEKRWEFRKCS